MYQEYDDFMLSDELMDLDAVGMTEPTPRKAMFSMAGGERVWHRDENDD